MATKKAAKTKTKMKRVLRIGNKVLVRTVSYFLIGEIVRIDQGFLMLSEASWVADTGRFHEALQNGTLNEVEPVLTKDGCAEVSLGAIVDVFTWDHALPRAAK